MSNELINTLIAGAVSGIGSLITIFITRSQTQKDKITEEERKQILEDRKLLQETKTKLDQLACNGVSQLECLKKNHQVQMDLQKILTEIPDDLEINVVETMHKVADLIKQINEDKKVVDSRLAAISEKVVELETLIKKRGTHA